jgi:hypothetical protein
MVSFTPLLLYERTPSTQWMEVMVDPRADKNTVEKSLLSLPEFKLKIALLSSL